MIAERRALDRNALDEFALASHENAAIAAGFGAFGAQIVGITDFDDYVVCRDEGIRCDTTIHQMASPQAGFHRRRNHPRGNSSQISDGTAALLFTFAEQVRSLGVRPMAGVHTAVLAGADPVIMLTAPISATQKALKRSGLGDRRHRRV